jgi:hypothetical protein
MFSECASEYEPLNINLTWSVVPRNGCPALESNLKVRWIVNIARHRYGSIRPVSTNSPPTHNVVWMVSGDETRFHWIPIPDLTIVVSYPVLTNHMHLST